MCIGNRIFHLFIGVRSAWPGVAVTGPAGAGATRRSCRPEAYMDYCFIREGVGEERVVVLVEKSMGATLSFIHAEPLKGGQRVGQ